MRVFIYFLKTRILSALSYQFNILFMVISSLLVMIINISIWRGLYRNTDYVNGVNLQQMIIYTIISTILGNIFYTNTSGKLAKEVSSGSIAYDMCRPFSYLLRYFGEDIGDICSSFILRGIPMFLIASFLFVLPVPDSAIHFILFLVSLVFCYCILWLFDAIFGMINFWTVGFGNLAQVSNTLVRILSGAFVPLWFYPDKIQEILYLTPFPYSYQAVVSIYIGKTGFGESVKILCIQIIWVAILFAVLMILYKKANKKIVIQGG